jgi:hypothetical protein
MSDDLFRYKSRFLTLALLLGYAFIHTKLTGVYVDTSLTEMANLSIRLPFGQRLLIPAIVHCLKYVLPLSIDNLFFLMEWLFISLFYFTLTKLLAYEFAPRQAQLLSWLFILLLPLMTVINYRYTSEGAATFFYPCDTGSLFFMSVGYLLCLRERWRYLIPWIFLATFNRESSILLVLLIPALHWQKVRSVIGPFVLALLAYCFARSLVLKFIHGVPGAIMEWYFRASEHTYFEVNLYWLLNELHLLLFTFCFAGLPLFWFAFSDYIPLQYRPLRFVALFYFIGLLLVGNLMEARLFNEILVLFYLPVCIALSRWIANLKPYTTNQSGVLFYVNRYVVVGALTFIVLFRQPLNVVVIWLSHHLT